MNSEVNTEDCAVGMPQNNFLVIGNGNNYLEPTPKLRSTYDVFEAFDRGIITIYEAREYLGLNESKDK